MCGFSCWQRSGYRPSRQPDASFCKLCVMFSVCDRVARLRADYRHLNPCVARSAADASAWRVDSASPGAATSDVRSDQAVRADGGRMEARRRAGLSERGLVSVMDSGRGDFAEVRDRPVARARSRRARCSSSSFDEQLVVEAGQTRWLADANGEVEAALWSCCAAPRCCAASRSDALADGWACRADAPWPRSRPRAASRGRRILSSTARAARPGRRDRTTRPTRTAGLLDAGARSVRETLLVAQRVRRHLRRQRRDRAGIGRPGRLDEQA